MYSRWPRPACTTIRVRRFQQGVVHAYWAQCLDSYGALELPQWSHNPDLFDIVCFKRNVLNSHILNHPGLSVNQTYRTHVEQAQWTCSPFNKQTTTVDIINPVLESISGHHDFDTINPIGKFKTTLCSPFQVKVTSRGDLDLWARPLVLVGIGLDCCDMHVVNVQTIRRST